MPKKTNMQATVGHTAVSGKDLLCTDVKFDASEPAFADAHFIFISAAPGVMKNGVRTYETGRQLNFKMSMNKVTSIAACLEQCIRGAWDLFEDAFDDGCPTFMANKASSKFTDDETSETKWIKIKPVGDERRPGDPVMVEFMEGGNRIHFVFQFWEAIEFLENLRQTVCLCKTLEMARRLEIARRQADERKEDQAFAKLSEDDEEVTGLSAADKAKVEAAGGKFGFVDNGKELYSCDIKYKATTDNDGEIGRILAFAGYRYRHKHGMFTRKIVKYVDFPYGNVQVPQIGMSDFGSLAGAPVRAVVHAASAAGEPVADPAPEQPDGIDMKGGLPDDDYAVVASMPKFEAKVIRGKVTFKGDARNHDAYKVLVANGWTFSGAPNYRWEKK